MIKQVEIKVLPDLIDKEDVILAKAAKKAGWSSNQIKHWQIVKRSIDARGRQAFFLLRIDLSIEEQLTQPPALLSQLTTIQDKRSVIVVGAGPAGYFAALELIAQGIKPIVLDRGKEVRARRRDLRAIQQFGEVNPHSNYCFGEGGAGTYSDGKLYTRSHKRGKIIDVLRLLVEHGASSDILVDAHPHIGSNKLPKIVANIRETILQHGGEIHFNHHVTDFIIHNQQIEGVIVNDHLVFRGESVILATGHSARDIYYLLDKKGIAIESKPYALGVRIEHPQPLIDKIQYNQSPRHDNLPAASYKLVCQVQNRGVFSFCMCPGGLIVPAATAPGEIVVNGMSMSRRDSPFANSGMVVAVDTPDFQAHQSAGIFAGLIFQQTVEQNLFKHGDGSQKGPAQRMTDFVEGRTSNQLGKSSYIPGLYAAPLHELLPDFIYTHLKQAMMVFGRKMKGYYTKEAQIVATESRTSSPIKIPRDRITYKHPQIESLYPCGEGAGYAGGILSAAMDGQNVAKAVAANLNI